MLDFTTNATEASQLRMQLAMRLAQSCPQPLFDTIAITGSTARGIADEASDIEINIWLDAIPPAHERETWLSQIGVEDIIVQSQPRSDGSIWINGTYYGCELEVGWQSYHDLEHTLETIMACRTTDHKQMVLADLIASAVTLRLTNHDLNPLAMFQDKLSVFPPLLAINIIQVVIKDSTGEDWAPDALFQPTILIAEKLTIINNHVEKCLRILFALNHQWEPNWKWVSYLLSQLESVPDDFLNNFHDIYEAKSYREALIAYLQWVISVLTMIPDNPQVESIIAYLQAKLSDM